MKLLIEDYPYAAADVEDILEGLFTLQDIEKRIAVSYVGYFYSTKVADCVFILPKVLIDEDELVFGKYEPADIIHLDEGVMAPHELKFIYEFAVWIHRAIVVFNDTHPKNSIVHYRRIEAEGHGGKKRSNTLLDIILSLIRFSKEQRSFFTFVLKNMHSGFNRINWTRTISGTTAIVEREAPVYLHPVNKRRQVNFDEELIIIFFSILRHVGERYGFRTEVPYGFKLLTGAQFDRYLHGYGKRRLRQIRYKYFSDVSRRLWDLCYAFFEKSYQINVDASQREYLVVKSFHVVFEAMIDHLIGDSDIPAGLKEQEDGKLVDHFYTYQGLISDRDRDNDIYYIGDSKYYKIGAHPGRESVAKQYTYARNVIQWNLNLFLDGHNAPEESDRYRKICLRDPLTEGYNVIPNFFISASIDAETLSYADRTVPHPHQPRIRRQFFNRLYDRDTLLLSHYDVNFLFVIALYARHHLPSQAAWREGVRRKFREAVQEMLCSHFDFYAMAPHPDVDPHEYITSHFQSTLGKTFSPFQQRGILSLALEQGEEYRAENERLLTELRRNFYVVPCPLGTDPAPALAEAVVSGGEVRSPGARARVILGDIRRWETREGMQVTTAEYVAAQSGGLT